MVVVVGRVLPGFKMRGGCFRAKSGWCVFASSLGECVSPFFSPVWLDGCWSGACV